MRRLLLVCLGLSLPAALAAQSDSPNLPGASDFGTVVSSYDVNVPSDSNFLRARAALNDGQYARARQLFAPLADGSMNPRVHLLAGYAELGAGFAQKAESRFRRALGLDRSSAYARHGLGLALVAQGRLEPAKDQLAALEAARDRCAGSCRAASDFTRAIASLRRAIG